jgi:hypothetical protein
MGIRKGISSIGTAFANSMTLPINFVKEGSKPFKFAPIVDNKLLEEAYYKLIKKGFSNDDFNDAQMKMEKNKKTQNEINKMFISLSKTYVIPVVENSEQLIEKLYLETFKGVEGVEMSMEETFMLIMGPVKPKTKTEQEERNLKLKQFIKFNEKNQLDKEKDPKKRLFIKSQNIVATLVGIKVLELLTERYSHIKNLSKKKTLHEKQQKGLQIKQPFDDIGYETEEEYISKIRNHAGINTTKGYMGRGHLIKKMIEGGIKPEDIKKIEMKLTEIGVQNETITILFQLVANFDIEKKMFFLNFAVHPLQQSDVSGIWFLSEIEDIFKR